MEKRNIFFKPTKEYKEFIILDLIEKNPSITQREISKSLNASVSLINLLINQYEKRNLLRKKKYSSKTVDYSLTKHGVERRKVLNMLFLKSSQDVYYEAKNNIVHFLNKLFDLGFKKILLYGAGDIADIILKTVKDEKNIKLSLSAVVDDDSLIQNKFIRNIKIISRDNLKKYDRSWWYLNFKLQRSCKY